MRFSRIILIFLIAVFISLCAFYYPNLPNLMAAHFNGAGEPDAWMSKRNFFLLEAGLLLLIILEFTLLPYLTAKMPQSLINIPNKDFWFAGERRAATVGIIGHFFEWFGILLLALFIGINQLVFRANLSGENLSPLSWLILAVFIFSVIIWTIQFFRRFKIKDIK